MGKISRALSKAAESDRTQSEPSGHGMLPVVDGEGAGKALDKTPSRKNRFKWAGKWDERFVAANSSSGAVAESIRNLRTRVLYPVMGDTPRSIMVTSATPGEGKSFICANLAVSLAQGIDSYCLVVDGDLRRPTQHKLFGLPNDRGLVDHLQKGAPPENLILQSGMDKLSILPAGPPPVNPAELSGSGTMIRLVDELQSRYTDRFILVDTPPLHAAAETAVLAQHVDGVVLVVRYGLSRRQHVRALVDTIGREKIIGVVFNAYETNLLDTKVFGYYNYQSSYYGEK